ncbi:hypothetical protein [Christiangramia sp. SM2212]|uniref:Uncharacterized protein n=1 Tax=Christiangramia sediminicola TaxID=3073267 RepID=A0ABU1ENY6_9FLAO|nr:hypothetical protein [Christiangramia sp. SM2212]MDR5590076.1 hypothetical protein [Christiangramia sp. SM2212]
MKLTGILKNMDASLANREKVADKILENPELFSEVVLFIKSSNPELSSKTLLALEIISRNNFEFIQQLIPELIVSGKKLKDSSSRRCLSKIYGLAINKEQDQSGNYTLSSKLKKDIIELSFQWLISDEKPAVKVFSMQNLFDLRNEQKWITAELKAILQKDILDSSAGYKSRATKILRKL